MRMRLDVIEVDERRAIDVACGIITDAFGDLGRIVTDHFAFFQSNAAVHVVFYLAQGHGAIFGIEFHGYIAFAPDYDVARFVERQTSAGAGVLEVGIELSHKTLHAFGIIFERCQRLIESLRIAVDDGGVCGFQGFSCLRIGNRWDLFVQFADSFLAVFIGNFEDLAQLVAIVDHVRGHGPADLFHFVAYVVDRKAFGFGNGAFLTMGDVSSIGVAGRWLQCFYFCH